MTNPNANQLYIKLYINDLVKLIRDCGLTRAQLGELVVLATFMNSDNLAWGRRAKSTYRAGKKSVKWTREIQHTLASKDALDLYADENQQNFGYGLPPCFEFGPPRLLRNTPMPKPDQPESSPPRRSPQNNAPAHRPADPAPDSFALGALPGTPWLPESEQQCVLLRRLVAARVGEIEACLLVQQFDPATITEKLDRSADKEHIGDRGAYVRTAIEKASHQKIDYRGVKRDILAAHAAAALIYARAVGGTPTGNKYTSDPFFRDADDQDGES